MVALPQLNIGRKTAMLASAFVLFFVCTPNVFGYTVENIPSVDVRSDFVVGPGKFELEINPGESKTVEIIVTNRMGDTRTFNITTEDFRGSQNTQDTVVLLGEDRGPYSLKDYVSVPEQSFVLEHAQRATIPITISVPADAEPGGLYGSLLINTASKPTGKPGPSSTIVARIGTLFFVTIPGPVAKEGALKEFATVNNETVYGSGPVDFYLLYENTGSVHLNPYGEISVKNMLGKEVSRMVVQPWFAMPDSVRLREVQWESPLLLGRYTAVASINRGYDNVIDTMEFSFWVVPVKLLAGVCGIIVVVILVLWFVVTRFEIRKKS